MFAQPLPGPPGDLVGPETTPLLEALGITLEHLLEALKRSFSYERLIELLDKRLVGYRLDEILHDLESIIGRERRDEEVPIALVIVAGVVARALAEFLRDHDDLTGVTIVVMPDGIQLRLERLNQGV